ncbi:MAG: hypothetical protein PVJ57_18640 [Phycisphaerae bacterium]
MSRTCCLLIALGGVAAVLAQSAPSTPPEVATIRQVWVSTGTTYANTDSLAACQVGLDKVRVFATAKDGDRVDVFDGSTGTWLRSIGTPGKDPGQLKYPNGIAVCSLGEEKTAAILVVERDNHRVQAFRADDGQPLGCFGDEVLHRPYGIAVTMLAGEQVAFVTDTEVPAEKTCHVFRIRGLDDQVRGEYAGSFGAAESRGVVQEAESIVVDDRERLIYLCDEVAKNVKVFRLVEPARATFVSTFADGLIQGDPEGITLIDTPTDRLVVLTHQEKKLTTWLVFTRHGESYRHVASFTGMPTIANTDGICVYPQAFRGFPQGAFFAVNDDQQVCAYSLGDIQTLAQPAKVAAGRSSP